MRTLALLAAFLVADVIGVIYLPEKPEPRIERPVKKRGKPMGYRDACNYLEAYGHVDSSCSVIKTI